MSLQPFAIAIEDAVLQDLHRRLRATRLPAPPAPGWSDGTDLRYLAGLLAHWQDRFDWRAQERDLNRLTQWRGPIDGTTLHLVHEKGRGPAPMPLLLVHGWPDGFFRFTRLIPLLTDPAAHGGDPADAFDVVAPSMPGYGFSERGPDDSVFTFGHLFHRLMAELGYHRYGAHGGDVGSGVCERLARAHPAAVIGLHLTDVPFFHALTPPADASPAETAYLDQIATFQRREGGYMHLQGTKPWTVAAGLNDSPAGLAAWIVEKFHSWSDSDGEIETRFSKDQLLTNIFLYWATQSIGTSFLTYRDSATAADQPILLDRLATPTGLALFPKDLAQPPREWADRFLNVTHWTQLPAGGHFAALEEPELLARELRNFFRPLRG